MKKNNSFRTLIGLIVLVICFITGRTVPAFLTDEADQVDYQTETQDSQQDGEQNNEQNDETEEKQEASQFAIDREGTYTSKEDVAAYLYLYQELPSNFITKEEAKELGWVSSEGNLHEVAPGMSIGGDYFGNYEGNLPEADGRDYYECDINYEGGYRGDERIVYSDDGLIYYTADHYETFELLYGEE